MKISHLLASLFVAVMAIFLAMPPTTTTTWAASPCSSVKVGGKISKGTIQGGEVVKFLVTVKNWGTKDLTNANLRVDLPAGMEYVGSVELPKLKPRRTPINLDTNIYWTDFTLRAKKGVKFEIKVRIGMM